MSKDVVTPMTDLDFDSYRKTDPVMANALERYGLGFKEIALLGTFEQQNVGGLGGPWRTKSEPPAVTTKYTGVTYKGDTLYWYGWPDLFSLRNVGYRRILHLVNWVREQGTEMPWFADFDTASARWAALEGQYRAKPA
jgi:hypothetical protein